VSRLTFSPEVFIMRASQWLLGLAAASSTIVAAVAAGCGGSSNNGSPAKDAAVDVKADVVEAAPTVEASVDAAEETACEVDADISTLNVPDASIGDSGVSAEACYSCIQTTCGAALTACNTDCSCKSGALTLFQCLGTGGSIASCLAPLVSDITDPYVEELGACLLGSSSSLGTGAGCVAQCGASGLLGGGDGGDAAPPPSDASDDAAKDAAKD
jgi:hypothetical protein